MRKLCHLIKQPRAHTTAGVRPYVANNRTWLGKVATATKYRQRNRQLSETFHPPSLARRGSMLRALPRSRYRPR